jgi:DNA polymerase epsilon subunit 3
MDVDVDEAREETEEAQEDEIDEDGVDVVMDEPLGEDDDAEDELVDTAALEEEEMRRDNAGLDGSDGPDNSDQPMD